MKWKRIPPPPPNAVHWVQVLITNIPFLEHIPHSVQSLHVLLMRWWLSFLLNHPRVFLYLAKDSHVIIFGDWCVFDSLCSSVQGVVWLARPSHVIARHLGLGLGCLRGTGRHKPWTVFASCSFAAWIDLWEYFKHLKWSLVMQGQMARLLGRNTGSWFL